MRFSLKVVTGVFAFALLCFGQISNVQFKDLDGNSYDLYEELGKGKHVLVHTQFNGWGPCAGSVPGLNAHWRKYGCDKCDAYKLMIIECNISNGDSKSAFTSWCNRNKVEYIRVWSRDGGRQLSNALNNNAGNPKYLIKPNKSVKKYPSSSEIANAGGNVQHVCPTPIVDKIEKPISNVVTLHKLNESGFSISVPENSVFSISLHALNGKEIDRFSETLVSAGNHTFSWENTTLAQGVYLAKLNVNGTQLTQKVIVE